MFKSYLSSDFPRLEYSSDYKSNPKAIHSGQRKLLLSEIEFLTRVLKDNPDEYTVLYIGAASGDHIPVLSNMFPEVRFILYDPARFKIKEKMYSESNKESARSNQRYLIKIYNKLFTDDEVQKYKGIRNLLFISDIRSVPQNQEDPGPLDFDPEFEHEVEWNMNQQKKWVEELRPYRSLLKFRLPFTKEKMTYFSGTIFFQAYPPSESTETRLEIRGVPREIEYDCNKYEEQMFYFNTVYRVQTFYNFHSLYGYSYDTIREYFILKDYFKLRCLSPKYITDYSKIFDDITRKKEKKIMTIIRQKRSARKSKSNKSFSRSKNTF